MFIYSLWFTKDGHHCDWAFTSQGCRKLFKVGGGANGVAKLGGQVGAGAKSWIFQTELGPIPVTRCDQCYAFFHQV